MILCVKKQEGCSAMIFEYNQYVNTKYTYLYSAIITPVISNTFTKITNFEFIEKTGVYELKYHDKSMHTFIKIDKSKTIFIANLNKSTGFIIIIMILNCFYGDKAYKEFECFTIVKHELSHYKYGSKYYKSGNAHSISLTLLLPNFIQTTHVRNTYGYYWQIV